MCYGNNTFVSIKIERVKVGKKIVQQRSEIKIYDKGKQYSLPIQNLTRIELAVKRMEHLKTYNIRTLEDLTKIEEIKPLGELLKNCWNNVIYFDKQLKWRQLTPFERKKILYYATPRNWEDFDKKQRYRAKKHFKELMSKYSTSTTHKEITELISQKINFLLSVCPPINQDL